MGIQKLLTKILIGILFSLLILSFAVWGIGDIFQGGGHAQGVAKVGDQLIEGRDFSTAFSREMSQLSRQFGRPIEGEQAVALGLDRRVLRGLISRTLFDQQAASLGMTVTENQEKQRILSEPAFKDELGNFDRLRFQSVLHNSGLSESGYLRDLRRDIMRGQIVDALIDGTSGPEPLAEALLAHRQERRTARYIVIPEPALADIEDPDEATLASYYEANKESFQAPESRAITMVYLSPDDFLEEVSVSEDELQAAFEQRRETMAVPERRELDQLVINSEDEAKAALAEIEAGASLADLAAADEAISHVSLGLVESGDLLPALSTAAFALERGAVSAPVKSPVGWHLLQVLAIQPGEEPVFEEVRETLEREVALDKAVDSIITYINSFNDSLGGGASLEVAAENLGLPIRRIDAINRQGLDKAGDTVLDLPPLPVLMPVLFDTAAGEVSLMTETAEGGYFILRVDRVDPPAPRPLEEVREEAMRLWRQSEQVRHARDLAESLLERLQTGETLDALAAAEGLTVTETVPLLRDANSPADLPARSLPDRLFEIKAGESFVTSGDQGAVLAELSEIVPVDLSQVEDEREEIAVNLTQNLQADLVDQYLRALEKQFGVEIYENRVQEIITSY